MKIMNCRFCLAARPRKHITELKVPPPNEDLSHTEIIMFCLGIKIERSIKDNIRLCNKCFKKIREFHAFKTLALSNERKTHKDRFLVQSSLQPAKLESVYGGLNSFPDESNSVLIELKTESNDHEIKMEMEYEKNDVDTGLYMITTDGSYEEEIVQENITAADDEQSSKNNIQYEYIEDKEEVQNKSAHAKSKWKGSRLKKKVPITKQEIKVGPLRMCEECGKSVRYLKQHMRTHRVPEEERKMFQCDTCGTKLSSKVSLRRHNHLKHSSNSKSNLKVECGVCNKKVSNLKKHEKMHNPEALRFHCAVCPYRFPSQGHLDAHVSVHTQERPFECHACGARFRLKVSLGYHIRRVHENEKSQICQYCSKGFFKKYHLQVHLRTHTKERPFPCDECDRFFRCTTTLKNHKLIHAGVKNVSCTLCDKTFISTAYLTAHMKSHMREKKFPCQYCSAHFHRIDHRNNHERSAHLKHGSTTKGKGRKPKLKNETE